MRTTLDIDEDLLLAAREVARREGVSLGKAVSRLIRQALAPAPDASPAGEGPAARNGFRPFAARGVAVTDALIDRLRESAGA